MLTNYKIDYKILLVTQFLIKLKVTLKYENIINFET